MDHSYMHEPHETRISYWILGNMMKGAGIALILVVSAGIFLGVVWGVGRYVLPDQSHQMPSPYGQIEVLPAVAASALA